MTSVTNTGGLAIDYHYTSGLLTEGMLSARARELILGYMSKPGFLTGYMAQSQAQAVTEAGKAQALTLQLYVGGLTNYLDVVVAQQTELTALTVEVQVEVSRLQASVGLISALGGGWSTTDLPTEDGVLPFDPLEVNGDDRQPRPDGTGVGTEEASRSP